MVWYLFYCFFGLFVCLLVGATTHYREMAGAIAMKVGWHTWRVYFCHILIVPNITKASQSKSAENTQHTRHSNDSKLFIYTIYAEHNNILKWSQWWVNLQQCKRLSAMLCSVILQFLSSLLTYVIRWNVFTHTITDEIFILEIGMVTNKKVNTVIKHRKCIFIDFKYITI